MSVQSTAQYSALSAANNVYHSVDNNEERLKALIERADKMAWCGSNVKQACYQPLTGYQLGLWNRECFNKSKMVQGAKKCQTVTGAVIFFGGIGMMIGGITSTQEEVESKDRLGWCLGGLFTMVLGVGVFVHGITDNAPRKWCCLKTTDYCCQDNRTEFEASVDLLNNIVRFAQTRPQDETHTLLDWYREYKNPPANAV